MLHGNETLEPDTPEMQRLRRNDCAMSRWVCGIKDRDETPSDSLIQTLGIEDITSFFRCQWLRCYDHVQRATSCIKLSQTLLFLSL